MPLPLPTWMTVYLDASLTLRPTVWVLDSAEMHPSCLMAWEPEIPSYFPITLAVSGA